MKSISINEFSLSIPETPAEWKLYPLKNETHQAANQLTDALIKAIAATSNQQAHDIITTAMYNNAQYGACDTEPTNIVKHYLQITRNLNLQL